MILYTYENNNNIGNTTMNQLLEMFNSIFHLIGVITVLIIAFRIFLIWWNSPKQKGKRGEWLVATRLKMGLADEYIILNDIYLPLPDGTTTQIDHIVVSQYGVFVVETKTYSGWIFGDEKSKDWTQSIYRKKSRFQNPMRQNYRHICALANNLGIDKSYFRGVVVFTENCTFKTEMPAEVVYLSQVVRYITSFQQPIIKIRQVSELAEVIGEWQSTVSEERRSKHVENLKKSHGPVKEGENSVCPYCGGEMVLRKSRKNGTSFYGCKAYPRCRGIVKVS